jgi:hypothetical protein
MADEKEPMIGRDSRPSAIDYDAPISEWKYRDLVAVIHTEIEIIKPERIKPEHWKPEGLKPEGLKPEHWKPERIKPEQFKPEKELLKPEKELSKPEKPWEIDPGELVQQVADRVVQVLTERGVIRG